MNDDPRFIEEIKNADMTEEMIKDVLQLSKEAIQKFVIEQDIAAYLKAKFDEKYDPNWHCIVGKSFGSCLHHDSKHYIYYYIGEIGFLLFKFG